MKEPESDDEGESRTGAIKKKARVYPFEVLSRMGKNKRKELNRENGQAVHPAAMANNPAGVEDGFDIDEVAKELLVTPESPETLKKANKKAQDEPICAEEQRTKPPKYAFCSEVEFTVDEVPSKFPTRPEPSKLPQTCTSGTSLSPRQSSSASPATLSKVVSISLTTPLLPPGHRTGVSLLDHSLLNLHGSLSEGESEEDEKQGPSGPTPKKKRKRRRKKKSQ